MAKTIRKISFLNREDALQELIHLGADPAGCQLMAPKGVHRVLKIYDLDIRQANIIKQEMLSKGGEAAVEKGVADCTGNGTHIIMMATLKQYELVCRKLKMQPFGLKDLSQQILEALHHLEGRPARLLQCGSYQLPLGERTLVMGILNATPDSFSDEGCYLDPGFALEQAHKMAAAGADIIDLGAESTRPGHTPVAASVEKERLLPVLKRLVQEIKLPISVDTFKGEVAEAALAEGVSLLNDQWALGYDDQMAKVAAKAQIPIVLMHNQQGNQYRELMGDLIAYFQACCQKAEAAGIKPENLILDPGIGFGKDWKQNLEVLQRLEELEVLGLPILLGTSRKGFIGQVLDLPVNERVEGTLATVVAGIGKGADIVRVHDVQATVRAARMADALYRKKTGKDS